MTVYRSLAVLASTFALAACQASALKTDAASAAPPTMMPPQILSDKGKPPVYPAIAKRKEQQGRVVVRVWIDDEGVPRDASVRESSGHTALDQSAVDAVSSWSYLPARRSGIAEGMWFNVPINFKLADGEQARVAQDPQIVSSSRIAAVSSASEGQPSYGEKIATAVRRQVVFPDAKNLPGNPGAEFDVRLNSDGFISSVDLVKTSGIPDWDAAALRALRQTKAFPLDVNGKAPPRLLVTLRPKR